MIFIPTLMVFIPTFHHREIIKGPIMEWFSGAAEAGVQGVQLHTQYFAPAVCIDQALSRKFWSYIVINTPKP